jgi:hypothetical protein
MRGKRERKYWAAAFRVFAEVGSYIAGPVENRDGWKVVDSEVFIFDSFADGSNRIKLKAPIMPFWQLLRRPEASGHAPLPQCPLL